MWYNENLEAYLFQTSKRQSYKEAKSAEGRTHLQLLATKRSITATEDISVYPEHTALETEISQDLVDSFSFTWYR